MRSSSWLVAAGGVVALLSAVPAGAASLPTTSTVEVADTSQTTAFGVGLTVPKDWTLRSMPGAVVLAPPESGTEVAVVDEPTAADGADAAARAWRLFRPGFDRKVLMTYPTAPRELWDAGSFVSYETSPNERRVVFALALRKGPRWTVLLIDGASATVEKRGAALGLISETVRPANATRETFAGRTPHALDPERIAALKTFVESSMKALGVPGASIALIDHGQVVFEGGFGVRELGRPEPVDADTLFMVASNTKGMSTLLLAKLVDQGKLAWDEPVTRAYPGFRLGNDATTAQVRIRDLVCACTGLPRKDFESIFNTPRGTQAKATFALLADTQPTSKFGEVFQYNNLIASAAGYIGGHLVNPDREVGTAYDAAMQTLIFDPLGMRETTFDFERALRGDHASPHGIGLDGKPHVAEMDINYEVIPYRPAGGAWSSAHDMIKYVRVELEEGQLPDGRRLVSAKNLLARRAPRMPIGEDSHYGMGLEVETKYGVTLIHHGGSLAGFKSDWFALPDARVGAVILTNADEGGTLTGLFGRRLLEILYDGKPMAEAQMQVAATNLAASIAKSRELWASPPDPAATAMLASRYLNNDLGHINVVRDGRTLVFDFGLWKSRVASRKNPDGTVSFLPIDPGVFHVPFVVSEAAGRRELVLRDGQHEYIYSQAP